MRPQEILAKKRDGEELTDGEIRSFVDGVCDGAWADYQVSAMAMAMVIRGLTEAEQDALTDAMLHSGEVLDFSGIGRPKGDKHSTGGVGDKCSLIIAPVVAACGVAVPMISGRGLGHTGGTLDKLESIPGYNVNLTTDQFHRIIDECGFAMAGQTDEIAPADKKLYALRDATATVPCLPLIVASIMSKKLAEGLDALILDVKTGSGAFLPRMKDSVELARALVRTGRNFGVKTDAVISDMSQPLGQFVGNSLEVYECIEILRGSVTSAALPTWELSLELSARLLLLAGAAEDMEAARAAASKAVDDGRAFELFKQNVQLQGGDTRVCDDPEMLLGNGLDEVAITSAAAGFVHSIDASVVGVAIAEIGGGRTKAEDKIDHAVGLANLVKIGDPVSRGDRLGVIYCRQGQSGEVGEKIHRAYHVADNRPETLELIYPLAEL